MNLEELEYWKKRVTNKRNNFVQLHSELMRKEIKTTNESIAKDEKLYYYSNRIARMKKFYDRLVKKE